MQVNKKRLKHKKRTVLKICFYVAEQGYLFWDTSNSHLTYKYLNGLDIILPSYEYLDENVHLALHCNHRSFLASNPDENLGNVS